MRKITEFIKINLIFLLIVLIGIVLEIVFFNNVFFLTAIQRLHETKLLTADGAHNDFSESNGKLFSLSADPNITYKNLDKQIRFISIDCQNSIPNALGQVFYKQSGQGFSEENSLIYPLSGDRIVLEMPKALIIDSLRFDLTNQEGDHLVCEEIIINPRIGYRPHLLSYTLIGLGIAGVVFGKKIFPIPLSNKIWENLVKNGFLFFLLLIIILDFAYPPTITYDSAQYLYLSDLIRTGNWANWDPLRTLIFPLKILLSLQLFGHQINALLLLLITAHLVLFIFSYLILLNLFSKISQLGKIAILSCVFLFVILDPTIFGYYHVLLTEYLAATIAVISCYLAIRIYKARPFLKEFIISSVLLITMVPIAWHIKQPYAGSAFFPLLIVCFLISFRKFSWKKLIYSLLSISVAFALVFSTNRLWNNFLKNKSDSLEEERLITSQLDISLDQIRESLIENPGNFLIEKLNDYLISINFRTHESIDENPEYFLTYGFQNSMIAHRMYTNSGEININYDQPAYDPYTSYFFTHYDPPLLINHLFLIRMKLSNLLFTVTNLLLPFFVLCIFIIWLRRKNLLNGALLVLGATSLFNALGHLIIWPIDRYLFLGYPLNLLILLILFFLVIKFNLSLFSIGKFIPEEI